MDARSYFEGKKITLMRIGLLGRGVGDAAYLANCGAQVLVVDSTPQEVMQPSVDALKEFSNITFKFGPYDLEDFRNCDMVLKGSGTPMDSPEIAEAHKNGIPVRMSADLFVELAQIPVIGVTGTRGKSTTTQMIFDILVASGKHVLLGGNVRGVSTLALLPEVTSESIAVLELDSWQLQGFGEAKMSPHIAVFTTFFPDHLNYYDGNLDTYLADKANIFLFQKPGDTLILGSQCAGVIQGKYSGLIQGWTSLVGESDLPNDWKLKVPGEHNRYAAALARRAVQTLDVEDSVIRTALENFGAVPGRLELIATVDGVDYYNDTNATTPDATLAGIVALSQKYAANVLLIMGGADKGIDMKELLVALPSHTKHIELLAGTGTDRIRNELPDVEVFDNLVAAVGNARRHAQPGDAIILSPAFASFGMFKNEYDRGDQFNAIVKGFEV